MAVTSGFFDAVLSGGVPDRKYGADEFGAIFDGIISDGIFKNYPAGVAYPFKVTPPTDSSLQVLAIQVAPGRAWLDKTWTLNTASYTVQLADRNVNQSRTDGIFIKVDKNNRMNDIVAVNMANPPIDDDNVKYHLIALVQVKPGVNTDPITEDDITNKIGEADGTPYVQSLITDMNATTKTIIENLETQFDSYKEAYGEEFITWFESIKDQIGGITPDQIVEVAEMVAGAYSSDYLSGVYPYVEGTGLYLSSDKEIQPPVFLNFGFVSASMSKNPNANELTVITEEIST
jgi:hypothetical protein